MVKLKTIYDSELLESNKKVLSIQKYLSDSEHNLP